MEAPLLRRRLAREIQLPFANREIPGVYDFGNDVHAVFELEGNEVGFAVLDFIERGLLAGCAADVGEVVVVVDRGNEKWFARQFRVEGVIKPKFRGVAGTKLIDLLGCRGWGGADLLGGCS